MIFKNETLKDAFGPGSRRVELFKSGGYCIKRFGGWHRGYDGELDCLVGYRCDQRTMARNMEIWTKAGYAICSAWEPSEVRFDLYAGDRYIGATYAKDEWTARWVVPGVTRAVIS